MAAFGALPPRARSASVLRAIERGAEFYLERGLLREGRKPYAPWLRLHYPVHYYYDLLVGLDFLTALGYGDDRRGRQPGRDVEPRPPPPGLGGPELPRPAVVLLLRPRGPRAAEPVDHRCGAFGPPTGGPV